LAGYRPAFKKKKKPGAVVSPEDEVRRTKLPRRDDLEMFGVVTQRVGGTNIRIMCEDNEERICRIPGKLKKRVWMRVGDYVIVKLWDFQKSKADVVWRYTQVQAEHLKRKGYLDKLQGTM